MISARNYAAQAERGILSRVSQLGMSEEERAATKIMAAHIRDSVHFAIPDGGKVLDAGYASVAEGELSLPYPRITVECSYISPAPGVPQAKIVILAEESEDEITISELHSYYGAQKWAPQPYLLMVDRKTPLKNGLRYKDHVIFPSREPTYLQNMAIDRGGYVKRIMIAGAFVMLAELLVALSCKNVSTAIHQEVSPKNEKRIKNNKLPIYETKVLVVDVGYEEKKEGRGPGGGSHASPRQHLRRGHIRRLEKGNVWVNSCVVGDPTKGRIDKQYHVRP